MVNTLKDFRSQWGISQEKLAFILGVSTRTIARAEARKSIPRESEKAFHNLVKIMKEFKGQEGVDVANWLIKPNKELYNNRPLDLLCSYYATTILLQKIKEGREGGGL